MNFVKTFPAFLLLFFISINISAQEFSNNDFNKLLKLEPNKTGLKLPEGFVANVIAENVGRPRHIAISPEGILYIKLERLLEGKGIAAYKLNGIKPAKFLMKFGNYGGTGIYIKNKKLYASSNTEIFRYSLNDEGIVINPDKPEKIVEGLMNKREHESKSIALDNAGNIYVNIGAPSNACQEQNRTKGSKGISPCPILDSAGGIWQFKTDVPNQSFKNGVRYATGIRNVLGLEWNNVADKLCILQHGRDQLFQFYPELYTEKLSAELPAETMYLVNKDDNCGWPYVYYDHIQKKKILNPEYGGDGKKEGGENAIDPILAFPGHLAPSAILFYNGSTFPEKYKNGAFIVFHGSWNRAPEKQKGYFVAFVPFVNGNADSKWEIFADNFAMTEEIVTPNNAKHRPFGISQGADGALYVADDEKGNVYRISYTK